MSKFYEDILDKGYGDEELFYKIVDYVLMIEMEESFYKLDEIEKNFFGVGFLLGEVNSGGFQSYFVDAGGIKYARNTLQFLYSIDEKNFSNLLNLAINVFESDKADDEKFKCLDDIDSEFYELTSHYNTLYTKCIHYLKLNQV